MERGMNQKGCCLKAVPYRIRNGRWRSLPSIRKEGISVSTVLCDDCCGSRAKKRMSLNACAVSSPVSSTHLHPHQAQAATLTASMQTHANLPPVMRRLLDRGGTRPRLARTVLRWRPAAADWDAPRPISACLPRGRRLAPRAPHGRTWRPPCRLPCHLAHPVLPRARPAATPTLSTTPTTLTVFPPLRPAHGKAAPFAISCGLLCHSRPPCCSPQIQHVSLPPSPKARRLHDAEPIPRPAGGRLRRGPTTARDGGRATAAA